ncbi:secreted subtilisin-like serine protease [Phycomyces blakesleeanus]|uniref:Secreted subtilisin-like serine protease n=2 Tax=Phycomyces blakesleeanus TaxID=4837 RepID=A0A162TRH5_PHYB8|nr:secreted subtilisin-like serine protease [Phycomyces blakesleeanus NRRL 1555(-)]OAD70482.1 secreted subtilisin-like serine protease [Phycomyces blakesleeanus NRRL 1555(-)]|eukprot:XP_018288522.1 secreted subtilisin-like serine protease [Phycomyces blakesleeanus NRRL 1555(-)]
MKRRSFSVLPLFTAGVCLAVLILIAPSEAVSHSKYKPSTKEVIPNRYVVEFNYGDSQSATTFVNSVKSKYKKAKVHVAEQFEHKIFSGISFGLEGLDEEDHNAALKSVLDQNTVKAVYPVNLIKRPDVTFKSVPASTKAPSILPHAMTQVDRVHSELKKFGKGVKVGVVDTGVDYLHPALGGGFGEGFKVQYGYDLVGNAYTGYNTPVPDSDPIDSCTAESGASGHGTHVSGIIAGYDAQTNFTGVAPQATLGMWRVFGCTGSTGGDVLVKAFLMAYDAGMDVISVSIGEASAWTDGPDTIVAQRIAEDGIPFIVSASNSGADGAFTVGMPSTAKDVWSVASVDNNYYLVDLFKASTIADKIPYLTSSSSKIPDGTIAAGDKNVGSGSDACSTATIPDLTGKIAIVQRGSCTFDDKATNVAKAGAIGLIVYNSANGDSFTPSNPTSPIPVAGISTADGLALLDAIKAGTTTLKFDTAQSLYPLISGNTVSDFSSVGASYELDLKPNVAGIGGQVFSTLPRFLGSWGMMSGTSMAAPYVSGSVALFIEARGLKKKNQVISEQFKNYALQLANTQVKTSTENPLLQGAGLVQVYDAISAKVRISPTQLSFNDTSSTKYKTQTLSIYNSGKVRTTFKIINEPSIAVAPYDRAAQGYAPLAPTGFSSAKAKLVFSKTSITLNAGEKKTIRVTVVPPNTDPKDHIMYGGFIHFKSGNQKAAIDATVPYFGVVGKQIELPIFDAETPYLSDPTGGPVYLKNETYTYDRTKSSTAPTIVYRLLTPTAKFDVDVLNAKTKKSIGKTFTDYVYLSRNTFEADNYISGAVWDATYVPTGFSDISSGIPVPSGNYILNLRALKLFGNPKNSKDWETFQTGTIVVKN